MKTVCTAIAVILVTAHVGFSQSIGTPKIPEDWIKTTVLIERREVKQVQGYASLQGAFALKPEGKRLIPIPLTNVFVQAAVSVTNYYPIGSGLLFGYSNINFIVTANHVVPANEEVFYRIPQKESKDAVHYSHLSLTNRSGIGWIRDPENDLAVTIIAINAEKDDVKKIILTSTIAEYEDVTIGDHIFVVGYPSSVVALADPTIHFIRNGLIASKLGNRRILIDSFLFPGNSGGPVFWKPSMGLDFTNPKIPGRSMNLVGIVSRTLSYREEAKSAQTGRTRVVFEENSGLCEIISSSLILNMLQTNEELTSAVSRLAPKQENQKESEANKAIDSDKK